MVRGPAGAEPNTRLLGQTLGLYGFGNVARCTARRAKAFGMHVIAFDPYVSELNITGAGVEPVGFTELLERSDYYPSMRRTTRTPSTPSTPPPWRG